MTPSGLLEYRIQLKDAVTGASIITSGGTVYVAANGDAAKQAIKDSAGAAASNPMTPTRGFINFFTAVDVSRVDLYIMAPGGQFIVAKNIDPSGANEILVDTAQVNQVAVIPFAIGDTTANTETDTGFDTGTDKLWLPGGVAVKVSTLDSGMTIDVGTDGAGSNDPDGFIDGISLTTAVVVKATNATGAVTLGALFYVQDSANAGDDFPEAFKNAANENITYTLSSSTDTGEGFIFLPYILAA
jgi:hypothetical protein